MDEFLRDPVGFTFAAICYIATLYVIGEVFSNKKRRNSAKIGLVLGVVFLWYLFNYYGSVR